MQGRPGIYRAEHQRIGGRGDLVLGETVCACFLSTRGLQTQRLVRASGDSIHLLLYYYQYEHLSPAKSTKNVKEKKKPMRTNYDRFPITRVIYHVCCSLLQNLNPEKTIRGIVL